MIKLDQKIIDIKNELGMKFSLKDEFVGIGLTYSEDGTQILIEILTTNADADWIKSLGNEYQGYPLTFLETGKFRILPAE